MDTWHDLGHEIDSTCHIKPHTWCLYAQK